MKITIPDNCLELLKQCISERDLSRPEFSSMPSYFYESLELVPEFARDPDIYPQLLNMLETEAYGYRLRVAKILLQIGEPLGILHLTYNSMIVHPLLKIDQVCSGWTNKYLLSHIEKLTDELVELLINELHLPLGLWHADILSALPAERIVPHMRLLLKEFGYPAIAAAYVLAMKGNDEGRPILEKLLESQNYIEFALIALSHIPDEKTMRYLRAYANPDHPIYPKTRSGNWGLRRKLMRSVQCRLFLLECRDPYPVRRTMEQFYLHSLQELIANDFNRASLTRSLSDIKNKTKYHWHWEGWEYVASRWLKPAPDFNANFFVINPHLLAGDLEAGIPAPDFLCEFSSPEDRAYCAEIQRVSIRALLNTFDCSSLGNGDDMGIYPSFFWGLRFTGVEYRAYSSSAKMYLPGFRISYERDDYEQNAIDWILNPSQYRFGSGTPQIENGTIKAIKRKHKNQ